MCLKNNLYYIDKGLLTYIEDAESFMDYIEFQLDFQIFFKTTMPSFYNVYLSLEMFRIS